MGFLFNLIKRLIKTVVKLSLYVAIFALVIVLIPNLPPYTKFTKIELTETQPQVGPLALNNALNNAEKMYKGKLLGPEAFELLNGELYTSLATGEIVKISPGGHVTFVTKVGQPCSGLSKEHICGRPLGFQIDDKGQSLYLADAYHGIWKIDLKTDKKQLLVSPRVEIEKRQPKLFNCIALAKNGDFYWTDSTSDFHLKDGAISMLTDPSGRLFYYSAAKNESKVLLDDLWFANGIVLSPKNDYVLVAESSRYRIVKHYVAGPKKGKTEVFLDGLPGVPDNMRVLPDGSGVLVGLYTVFSEEHPLLTKSLAATPIVRKFLARLQRLAEIPFEYLNNLYPHIMFEEIVYHIGHFKSLAGLAPPMSGLLQVDWNGNIVASYYNTDGSLGHISDAIVYNNKLFTGNPHLQDFIGSVPVPPLLKKAYESTKTSEPKVEVKTPQQAKPVEQVPKKKTEEKPITQAPKMEPKEEKKRNVDDKPKVVQPKVAEKPKVEEKKEAPKVTKPAGTTPPPAQQAKSPEPAKPTEKHVVKKPSEPTTAPPAQSQPTPAPPKPTAAPKTPETTKTPAKSEPKTTTPKPETKSTPKPAEKTIPPAAKTTEAPKKVKKDPPPTPESKPKPIKEEIPSDTAKPPKETLKVIKKAGPTEIPVPNQ